MTAGRLFQQLTLITILTLNTGYVIGQDYSRSFNLSATPNKYSIIECEPLMINLVFEITGEGIRGQANLPDLSFRDEDLQLSIQTPADEIKQYNSWEQITSDTNYSGSVQPVNKRYRKESSFVLTYNWKEQEFIFSETGQYTLTFTVRVRVTRPDHNNEEVVVEADPLVIIVEPTPPAWKAALERYTSLERVKYASFWQYQSPEKRKRLDQVISFCSEDRPDLYSHIVAASLGSHLAAMEDVSAAPEAARYLDRLLANTDSSFPLRKEILYFGSQIAYQMGDESKGETCIERLQNEFPGGRVAGKNVAEINRQRN